MKETGLVFYFESIDKDMWSGRKLDLDAWNYNCKIGNINKVIIVNKTGQEIKPFDISMDITIVDEMPQLEGRIAQMVCPWEKTESTPMWDFDHDVDWYVFGPASGWSGNHFGEQITIPQNGIGAHHSVFVCTTVMFHRYHTLNN